MEAARNISDGLDEREQLRIEFYATYDVMTGIRIAATLGGFFGLMVFLVIYKSRSKSVKALKDPKIAEIAHAAAAEEEAEEEERQMAYALEEALGARCSLAGSLAPWPPRPRSARFSSLGGGCGSLLAPPRRLRDFRGDSLPASTLILGCRSPYFEDELVDAIDDSSCTGTAPSEYVNKFLSVPGGSRRYSNITCSSSGSSYLERRGSSIVCALPNIPPSPRTHKPKRSSRRNTLQPSDVWSDSRNPIDIQVIQATPELSPCASERTVVNFRPPPKRAEQSPQKKAPLASIGSCGVSVSVDYQDCDLHSVGSDSVFMEDECVDTDDEVEQFSTDSDESVGYRKRTNNCEETRELRPRRRSKNIVGKSIPIISSPPVSSTLLSNTSKTSLMIKNQSLFKPISRQTLRRLSHPTVIGGKCSTISAPVNNPSPISEEVSQESRATLKKMFPLLPFTVKKSSTPNSPPEIMTLVTSRSQDDVELGMRAEDLSKSQSPLNPESCSRSQETLF